MESRSTGSTDLRSGVRRILQWPLLHFVLLGTVLFLCSRWYDGGRIAVAPADVAAARLEFATLLGVPRLSEAQLSEADQRFVTDELLFREALRRGLDRGDPVIRQRLVQKLLYAEEELQLARRAPTDQELRTIYAEQDSARAAARRYSFDQLYFPQADEAQRAAIGLRRHERSATSAVAPLAAQLGARPFPLGADFESTAVAKIVATFGASFATAIASAPVGAWTGPVESRYGWHLVRLRAAVDPPTPGFASIEPRLRAIWLDRQRRIARDALIRRVARRQELVVAGAGDTPVVRNRLQLALAQLRSR
ncbi:MAG: peptidylprolyl isomerase [Steroidobacteraceae bacterium]